MKTLRGALALFLILLMAPVGVSAQTGPGADAGTRSDEAKPVQGEVTLKESFGVMIGGELIPEDANADTHPKITVGTPLVLTLEVVRPINTSLALPSEQSTGRFELLKVDRVPEVVQPGDTSLKETIQLHFAVYRPGRHILAGFELKIMDAEGGISSVKTSPVNLRVTSVLANEKDPQMASAQAPVSVWTEDWTLVWIGGVLLSLLIAGLLGAWLYRAFGPKPPPPPPPPPRPAHEIALEKLGAIAAANLPEKGEYEAFYVRVSEAVREYLGRRYNLSITDQAGLELTTEELLVPLREVRLPRGMDRFFIESLLYDCDIVKFARYTPSEDEAGEVLMKAFQLVELTRGAALGDAALGSEPVPAAPVESKVSTVEPSPEPIEAPAEPIEAPAEEVEAPEVEVEADTEVVEVAPEAPQEDDEKVEEVQEGEGDDGDA